MSFTIGARGVRTALAALAMSAALAVPQAEAGVTFPGEGVAFNVSKQSSNLHAGIGAQNVWIKGSNVINTTAHVSAGGFALKGDDGVGDFIAWCLDTMKYLTLTSTYAVNHTNPFTNNPVLTASQKTDIKRLFDTAYDALLGGAPNNEGSAAFQLALWEIVNEKNGAYDLSGGSFYTTSNPGASGAANTLLGKLGDTPSGNYRLVFLESVGKSQNLVSVVPVPLPAAGILMLAALAGGAAAYNRRRKAA